MNKKLLFLVAPLMGACFFSPTDREVSNGNLSDSLLEYRSVYDALDKHFLYADSLASQEDYEKVADPLGLLLSDIAAKAHDPYTDYMDPAEAAAFEKLYTNPTVSPGMLGFQMVTLHAQDSLEDTLKVMRVYEGSPAQKMGLKKGDLLLKANDQAVTGAAISQYGTLTTGGTGTVVKLEVLRGQETLQFTGTKAEVLIPSVFVDSVAEGLSSIQISQFLDVTLEKTTSDTGGTWAEFRKALQQTQNEKVSLLDLRGNPGGSVYQCLRIADELLPAGDTMVQVEDRTGNSKVQYPVLAESNGLAETRSFVLLADGGSASCAEILLNALRDNTKYPLVGQKTFGKGIGQSFHETFLGGLVKMTSLQFLNTQNVTNHHLGFSPDFEVEGWEAQTARAISLAQGGSGAGGGAMVAGSLGSNMRADDGVVHRGQGGAYIWK